MSVLYAYAQSAGACRVTCIAVLIVFPLEKTIPQRQRICLVIISGLCTLCLHQRQHAATPKVSHGQLWSSIFCWCSLDAASKGHLYRTVKHCMYACISSIHSKFFRPLLLTFSGTGPVPIGSRNRLLSCPSVLYNSNLHRVNGRGLRRAACGCAHVYITCNSRVCKMHCNVIANPGVTLDLLP